MKEFGVVVVYLVLAFLVLGGLWGQVRKSRASTFRRRRAELPQEQQLAELTAELAVVVPLSRGRFLSVPRVKYPALTTDQARWAAEAQWPSEYLEVRETGSAWASCWLFDGRAPVSDPEPPRRLGPAVCALSVLCNALFLVALWFVYPRTDWLGVTGLFVAYGAGLFLLLARDVGRTTAAFMLLMTLVVGTVAVMAVVQWAHNHHRGTGSDSASLLMSTVFGLPMVFMPVLMDRGAGGKSPE
ncbi:hypothetical protein [Kitasatospora viridis]|uniref:Uncharacterized protein n=1 Tax=Kitasatospora viridis TaxID=281105 RepID=A0A561UML0_9ACTN|nr:hypothetical protein [Kitasatospora viridis]TWG00606.1 hypothetical protein FHX73_114486 [Kitasatospora viridis]